ncbi:hypothetical protein ABQF17_24985 [Mycolicibacterium elephantis]
MPVKKSEYETLSLVAEEIPYVSYVVKAGKILMALYDFGKDDPYDVKLAELEEEIARLNTRVTALEALTATLTIEVAKIANLARVRAVKEIGRDIETAMDQLKVNPGDADFAARAAVAIANAADALIQDHDAWTWTDIRQLPALVPGQLPRPTLVVGFKTQLALPVYAMAIAAWGMAIVLHSRSAGRDVRGDYRGQLLQHVEFIETRFGWKHGDAAQTIEEQIKNKIYCYASPADKYADHQGVCEFGVVAHNDIERTLTDMGDVKHSYYGPRDLCTYNPAALSGFVMQAWENDESVQLCRRLVDTLKSLAYSTQFPTTGRIIGDIVGEGKPTDLDANIYSVTADGRLFLNRYSLPESADPTFSMLVGEGWNDPDEFAVPGGLWAIYLVEKAGLIRHYYHRGAGKAIPDADWVESHGVAIGEPGQPPRALWGPSHQRTWFLRTKTIFGGGYGRLWAVDEMLYPTGRGIFGQMVKGGTLSYIDHGDYDDGQGAGWFTNEVKVKTSWGRTYEKYFSTDFGFLYGVTQDGKMYWHSHQELPPGNHIVNGPVQIGHAIDWSQYRIMFGAEGGRVFGLRHDDVLHCYLHTQFRSGGTELAGPITLSGHWEGVTQMFAALPPSTKSYVH